MVATETPYRWSDGSCGLKRTYGENEKRLSCTVQLHPKRYICDINRVSWLRMTLVYPDTLAQITSGGFTLLQKLQGVERHSWISVLMEGECWFGKDWWKQDVWGEAKMSGKQMSFSRSVDTLQQIWKCELCNDCGYQGNITLINVIQIWVH